MLGRSTWWCAPAEQSPKDETDSGDVSRLAWITVRDGTTLSYWIFPQSDATTPWVSAGSDDSTCVAVDLIFTDGSDLRDSDATDQSGTGMHPADQCGHLTLDAWNHVTVNLGAVKAGQAISKILVGYDRPGATGGYRGYLDDLSIA
ncbi:hypothetical protein AB0H86_05350 [Streptomyces sp. NPDC050997]|uniref:hypothetical protein n=1 Tax=Streptomyces sp. NPDC050997 TaxID=3155519 RepID=UPI003418215F